MNTKKYLKEHEEVFERREYKTVKSCLQNSVLRITILVGVFKYELWNDVFSQLPFSNCIACPLIDTMPYPIRISDLRLLRIRSRKEHNSA